MSVQRLGAKALRRIARDTGQEIVRGWANGGYVMGFVTPDHRHGWWDKKTGNWGWDDMEAPGYIHYSSCREFESGVSA